MDQDGIHLLVIEVIHLNPIDTMGSFPVNLDIILGKNLILGLRNLVADPFQAIGA